MLLSPKKLSSSPQALMQKRVSVAWATYCEEVFELVHSGLYNLKRMGLGTDNNIVHMYVLLSYLEEEYNHCSK